MKWINFWCELFFKYWILGSYDSQFRVVVTKMYLYGTFSLRIIHHMLMHMKIKYFDCAQLPYVKLLFKGAITLESRNILQRTCIFSVYLRYNAVLHWFQHISYLPGLRSQSRGVGLRVWAFFYSRSPCKIRIFDSRSPCKIRIFDSRSPYKIRIFDSRSPCRNKNFWLQRSM